MPAAQLVGGVIVGVDTHKHTHTAAAVTATGAVLEHVTVAADPAGYRRLLTFGRGHDASAWAIEGTGSFGAGLTTTLLGQGERVFEVDRPQRPAIRVLLTTRAQAVDFRTRAIAALHALVTSAPQQQRERLRDLPLGSLLRTCAGLRGSVRQSAEEFATVMALRATAKRALACESEAAELEARLVTLVERVAPWLLDQVGVGPVVAGQVLTSWSHRGRVHSEAAFAMLGGVAPIEASSGMVVRHRLNRSGDRQLNRALHAIIMVRLRQDPQTKAYAQRRLAEGKTMREIKRCLKRYVARQLFRRLETLPTTA